MSFVKPEPRVKEEGPDDSSQIPVLTMSDPASVQVKQEKRHDGGGVEGTAPVRSSFQDAAASSSSSSSRWVGTPGKAKQEPQATVTPVKKKAGVRKRLHGMIYNEVKRRIKGKTPLKCDVPPKASLPNGTAGWADAEKRKIKSWPTERDSGLRYIYWESGRRRWVVKYQVRGAVQQPASFSTGKWCAEGYAFEEAVAMALEEAKAHLAKVLDRPSGVRGVAWHKRKFHWIVRVRRRYKRLEEKRFYPTDKSDEAVARALREAAAHVAKVHERHGVMPWKDKSAKAKDSALQKARAHLRKRPVETRGITWHKHDLAWRVKLLVRSPKKRTEHTEDKRFPPRNTSDEEMHRTLEEARAHLMKLRKRSSVVEDKRFNPKTKSEQAVARALEETRADFAKLRGLSSGVADKRFHPKNKSNEAATRALEEADSTKHPRGIRGVTWHKRYFAWRIRLQVPSAAGNRSKRMELTCFRPKDKSDEAVARAYEEATAHLTKMRRRFSGSDEAIATTFAEAKASGVRGVTWYERDFCWRVRFEPRSAGKRMWMCKRFNPKDKSVAAIVESRQRAVQWRRILEARYQLFPTEGGRVLSKRGRQAVLARGGRARSKRERQQE